MKILQDLMLRSGDQCELCSSKENLAIFEVPPVASNISGNEIYICSKCTLQIEKKEDLDHEHWKCLSTSMWSEVPAVQVVSWRMLNRLRDEAWAADNLDLMYFDDETLAWAKATGDHEGDAAAQLHRDSNGQVLLSGDNVILIKSLDVKGSSVNARVGVVVKNIKLDPNDTQYIEGKIEGQSIMIKTMYLRKQNG